MAKFDHDTARLILLALENKEPGEITNVPLLAVEVGREIKEVHYCCLKLHEAGFVDMKIKTYSNGQLPTILDIYELTYNGHAFVDVAKDETAWNNAKTSLKKAGALAFPVIIDCLKAAATANGIPML